MSSASRIWRVGACASAVIAAVLVGSSGAGAATAGTGAQRLGLFSGHQWTGASSGSSAHAVSPRTPGLQVVASGLNQPHHLTIGPDGNLYVAEVGDGVIGAGCVVGTEAACANNSGTIDRITPQGAVTHVVTGLPSVGSPPAGSGGAGVAGVQVVNGKIYGVIQNQNIDPTTGQQTYGPAGALLGDLVSAPLSGGTATSVASFGPYEAANNPDHGAGSGPGNPAIDSDPYNVVAYNGGFAVADAAANDVLFVNAAGQISTLAVLPLISESTGGGPVMAQPVPTSLAVGPDGALYVGELGGVGGPGTGNDVGDVNVYRIAPGGAPTVYASGLTMIGSIAFDQAGRLLVMEIDTAGILDPAAGGPGLPAPGAIIRINADGSRTTLASAGLEFPLGITVAKDGSVYSSNFGVLPATGGPASGQVVRVSDPAPAGQLGANLGGYRLAASDGGVFTFGAFGFYGSMGGTPLNQPVVGLASNPVGPGYWLVAADGGIFSFGTSNFYGSTGAIRLNQPVVGMAPTPDGRGYWLVAADGGIFTFGDASFFGSTGATHLNKPIVGMAATPDGGGYDLFAADGGVFTFGDATFHGSHGGFRLNRAIVGGAMTSTGGGYDLFAADGGVFTYGDAQFFGSMGGIPLNKPVVGGQITPDNGGYLMTASDGGVFTFGNAQFAGSTGDLKLNKPIVGIG
jgi:hypothetical protein